MQFRPKHDVRRVASRFQIHGVFQQANPYGSGHINDTYCVVFDQGGAAVRYIFQRINHHIFKDPVALMENIRRVTAHLAGKDDRVRRRRSAASDAAAHAGRPLLSPRRRGNYWRCYLFIERARTYDAVEIPAAGIPGGAGVRSFSSDACRPADTAAARHDPRFSSHTQTVCCAREGHRRGQDRPGKAGKGGDRVCTAPQGDLRSAARRESAGARDAQRHQVQQRDARRRHGRGHLRD